ncbi:UDP-N-acetylmuramoyl-tripeptide--D-alanyl-D-alanine ligase [Bacillus sp. B15-48]|uniref:UDP-N-acetylmuramoyl-tripeptide--D-alanyl-D- alanine ligase n=1 Tax=Bacillus sp. B15-48 TaxID=1548601 RepID=UPI00193EFC26|nr:UDP-N-acetylmuramoyl-tripeptide--D-alanyl-D-alanine ligase [Bacillus sp. B15-48]MBM4765395.1 UDP-N-acetylmuramoyl-tripeptide--D-alanyl-D-alanine ligase [Bacillus sp. B15-48]
MIHKTLKQIAAMIGIESHHPHFEEIIVTGVTIDSRKIESGNLFIPFKGEKVDGHKFVEEAIHRGAVAALWQKDVPNPPKHLPLLMVEDSLTALQDLASNYRNQLDIKVLGITGSNGKTTTKDIAANLLSLKYKVQKTEGNFNNHIGLPLTILSLKEEAQIAVLEMGMSSRGEIEFLTKLAKPDAVIITNIGESHLLDLGSREAIAEAKLEIILGLKENGFIIYHGDEPLLQERLQTYNGTGVLKTFGRTPNNDLYPVHIEQEGAGSRFITNRSEVMFNLPILGTHNILNALAAMMAADFFGVSYSNMNEGFANLKLTNMRMELVEGQSGERIINDAYNASPTSMKAAIELVAQSNGYKRKILVLGDMLELGPLEEEFHYQIGHSLDQEKIDYVFTFGRLGTFIGNGAKQALGADRVFSYEEKTSLIKHLQDKVTSETLVLVKASRGMKLEEVVAELQK